MFDRFVRYAGRQTSRLSNPSRPPRSSASIRACIASRGPLFPCDAPESQGPSCQISPTHTNRHGMAQGLGDTHTYVFFLGAQSERASEHKKAIGVPERQPLWMILVRSLGFWIESTVMSTVGFSIVVQYIFWSSRFVWRGAPLLSLARGGVSPSANPHNFSPPHIFGLLFTRSLPRPLLLLFGCRRGQINTTGPTKRSPRGRLRPVPNFTSRLAYRLSSVSQSSQPRLPTPPTAFTNTQCTNNPLPNAPITQIRAPLSFTILYTHSSARSRHSSSPGPCLP